MNDNGKPTQTVQTETPSKSKRVLGRGLRDILAEQSLHENHFNDLQEHVKAARIGAAILELVDIVDPKYHPVIFKSVTAYRTAAQDESTEAIGRKLHDLEVQRNRREQEDQKPIRLWYLLYLK